jgi:hypothetical protein
MNNNFIRGHRAKCNFYYDDFIVPQEIIDQVVRPFVVIGDENTKYIIPTAEKPIKIVTEPNWRIEDTSENDYEIQLSRRLTDKERREFLNAINNGEIYLEDLQ